MPPPEPGMCQYNVEAGECQFQGEREFNTLDLLPLHLTIKMYVKHNMRISTGVELGELRYSMSP